VTRIVKAARDRLPDRVAIGVLTRTFPPGLVDMVIDEAGAREQRKRSLPARLVMYFVLAMWLWREHGYEEVLRQLVDGLGWSGADDGDGPDEADVAWSGSITKARTRLGVEPLRLLFARVAGPTGGPDLPGCFWRGLRLTVMDGSTMDVADSKDNRAAFDGPSNEAGPGAFPQVRLLVHAECGSKALLGATFDGYRTAETVLAGRLLGSLGPGMLMMADRQFLSWRLWRDAAATGADLLWRVSDSFTLPVIGRLPDGSYLSRLKPPRKRDGDPITVRIIEYTVTTTDEHGAQHSELFCLATTLLDPDTAPIEQIPALYHERWRGEMSHLWCGSSRGGLSFLVSLGWFGWIEWVPAAVLVIARGPVSQLAQPVEFGRVGGDDPVFVVAGAVGGDPSPVDPGVGGRGGHAQSRGQPGDRPFVLCQDRCGGAVILGADTALVQDGADLVTAEAAGAFGRAQPVGVERVGDLAGGASSGGQFADAFDQARVVGQLLQAGDRAHGLTGGFVAAGPDDGRIDQFAVAHDRDGDLLDQGPQQLLAVGVGGGLGSP